MTLKKSRQVAIIGSLRLTIKEVFWLEGVVNALVRGEADILIGNSGGCDELVLSQCRAINYNKLHIVKGSTKDRNKKILESVGAVITVGYDSQVKFFTENFHGKIKSYLDVSERNL